MNTHLLISRLYVNLKHSFQEVFHFVYSMIELTLNDKEKTIIAFFIHQWKVREVTKEQSLVQKEKKKKERKERNEGFKI